MKKRPKEAKEIDRQRTREEGQTQRKRQRKRERQRETETETETACIFIRGSGRLSDRLPNICLLITLVSLEIRGER